MGQQSWMFIKENRKKQQKVITDRFSGPHPDDLRLSLDMNIAWRLPDGVDGIKVVFVGLPGSLSTIKKKVNAPNTLPLGPRASGGGEMGIPVLPVILIFNWIIFIVF